VIATADSRLGAEISGLWLANPGLRLANPGLRLANPGLMLAIAAQNQALFVGSLPRPGLPLRR
jgi:hypothetical protein